ncbi:MAG: Mrp/NBP35 family ATP-binding protein [Gracilibacteraceae bacterium]|jgi:Mrp family chromosome partitioning ATPase|nr:Mrp/NBP35 family ATP-binding protein [Gracilibacteraceae bacterium]
MENEQCNSCPSGSSCGGSCPSAPAELTAAQKASNIKNMIAIMSGKGGVGKSSLTAMLAVALREKGFSVGVLDADVTGPSIPRLFGLSESVTSGEDGLEPVLTGSGLKIMSLNLMTPTDDTPVVWRGPMVSQLVEQFRTEVVWGELDYLLVDLPPGTGDIQISVFQSFPLAGVVTVTNPQQLAGMIVRKSVHMLNLYKLKNYGLIENMAWLQCPDCGKKVPLFGQARGEEEAAREGIPFLGALPLDPALTAAADSGRIEEYRSEAFQAIADKIIAAV